MKGPILDKGPALDAIKLFAKHDYVSRDHGTSAVTLILSHTKDKYRYLVAEEAINIIISRYKMLSHNPFSMAMAHEKLDLALHVAEKYGENLDSATKNWLLKVAAQAGLYGHFPSLPQMLLKRPPTAQEVRWLAETYLEKKVLHWRGAEQRLLELIESCIHGEQGQRLIQEVTEFARKEKEFDI